MTEDWSAKLSPDLRLRVARPLGAGEAAERVRVLVRFHGPVTALAELGLEPGNVAGGVATATVALGRLADVARSPSVVYVEGARPWRADEPAGPVGG